MIRVIIENVLLFLLPTLLDLAWVFMKRTQESGDTGGNRPGPQGLLDDAPLLWLFAAGAVLVVVTLIAFGSTSGGKPGQHYQPPSLKDGHIEPGRVE